MTAPRSSADVLIVTPPFSPFDAGPPLGPAVLAGHLEAAGIDCDTIDLNVRYLRQFEGGGRLTRIVGDHAKDHRRIGAARDAFKRSLCLPSPAPEDVPCSVDPILGLPHVFDTIDQAVERATAAALWPRFLEQHVFAGRSAPLILGVSVMGPAQVVPARIIARLARRRWPRCLIILGGSHITLLEDAIRRDGRYGADIDGVLPRHAEGALVDLASALVTGRAPQPLVRPGAMLDPATRELPPTEWRPPRFFADELALYDPQRLSLPIQLSRGCGYGRCRFCTYPAVERLVRTAAGEMAERMLPSMCAPGIRRYSVKDSLMTLPAMLDFGAVLQRHAPGAVWSATTKLARGMTAETMGRLAALGCRTVELGVETLDPRTQATIDKPQSLGLIDGCIEAAVGAGITVVVNLLYGLPGETRRMARSQLDWFVEWVRRADGRVHGSHNLVEINRGAPLARDGSVGVGRCGPWAFSHCWDAPAWRPDFAVELNETLAELRAHEEDAA